MFAHPLKALKVSMLGPRTDGPMAPDLPVMYGDRADATAIKIPLSSIQRRTSQTEANH
jgi:hypothetical protein